MQKRSKERSPSCETLDAMLQILLTGAFNCVRSSKNQRILPAQPAIQEALHSASLCKDAACVIGGTRLTRARYGSPR
jgi:hypothetical protein